MRLHIFCPVNNALQGCDKSESELVLSVPVQSCLGFVNTLGIVRIVCRPVTPTTMVADQVLLHPPNIEAKQMARVSLTYKQTRTNA